MQLKDVNNLKLNIYATMAYFDIFDFPLKRDEIERYLLWAKADGNVIRSYLNNDPAIQRFGDYYFFKGRREIVAMRKKKEMAAEKLWKKVRRFVPLLKAVPYVRMAAVCNSLAVNNADDESDIDLFIVVKKGRLFSARTFATILFSLLGVRRHGRKVKGRFCLSFFVTDDALDLKTIRAGEDDIYLPYWILTLKPLFGVEVHEKLLEANDWICGHFPGRDFRMDCPQKSVQERRFLKAAARFKERVLGGKAGEALERYLAAKHLARHRRKFDALGPEASVVVNEKMLKFHNVDRRKEISKRFERRFEEVSGMTF